VNAERFYLSNALGDWILGIFTESSALAKALTGRLYFWLGVVWIKNCRLNQKLVSLAKSGFLDSDQFHSRVLGLSPPPKSPIWWLAISVGLKPTLRVQHSCPQHSSIAAFFTLVNILSNLFSLSFSICSNLIQILLSSEVITFGS